MELSCCISPPMITGFPDWVRMWVVTLRSVVVGIAVESDDDVSSILEMEVSTFMVIIPSPDAQPSISTVKPGGNLPGDARRGDLSRIGINLQLLIPVGFGILEIGFLSGEGIQSRIGHDF